MRKTFMTILALAATVGVSTAQAGAVRQNTTEAQRRELEKQLTDLARQQAEIQRKLEELGGRSPRVRIRAGTPRPDVNIWGDMPGIVAVINKPKFGFQTSAVPDSGARITAVTPNSPAEKAGLKSGDVITIFNGIRLAGVDNPSEEIVKQVMDNIEVGDTVSLEYRRGKDRKTTTMVAADLGSGGYAYAFGDSGFAVAAPRFKMALPGMLEMGHMGGWMGVELVGLNKDLGEYFGATEGVLVVSAPRDSSLGLKGGDVILSIGGRPATSPSQAMRVLRSYERGETFEIQLLRQKKRITVTAKVPNTDRGFSWKEPGDQY